MLGRRVSASGRTERLPGRAIGLGGGPEAARQPAARLLRPARAPQADDLLGAARDPRRLRRRRAARQAAQLSRRSTAAAPGSGRSWPSCASATAPGSATSTSCATSCPRSRPPPPTRAEKEELLAERERLRHAEGLRLAAAAASAAISRVDEEGDGAAALLAAAQGAAGRGRRRRSGARRAGGADRRARRRAGRRGERAALLPRGDRGRPGAPGRGRGAPRRPRPAGAQARRQHRVGARARRALPGRDRAARERRGALGSSSSASSRRPRSARAELAAELSRGRAKAARALEPRVAEELEQLAMPAAKLEVVLEPQPDGFGADGAETVELRVSTNPGIEPAPLRDAASGGELSRVMLALSGLGAEGGAATLVFDEIDAGVGGKTAGAVGERLRALGEGRQVVCITHLPQVASLADAAFPHRQGGRRRRDPRRCRAGRRRRAGRRDRPHARRRGRRRRRGGQPARPGAAGGRVSPLPPAGGPGPGSPNLRPWQRQAAVASGSARRVATAPRRARRSTARRGSGARPRTWSSAWRPGDIAVIDHTNIDRIAAEELIATGVRAVINASDSSNGRYPNSGPLLLTEAGITAHRRAPLGALRAAQGRRPADDRGRNHPQRRRGDRSPGACSRPTSSPSSSSASASEIDAALADFAENTVAHVRERGRPADRRHRLPADPDQLPRPPRPDRRPRHHHRRDLQALRAYIRDVGRCWSASTAAPTRCSRRG